MCPWGVGNTSPYLFLVDGCVKGCDGYKHRSREPASQRVSEAASCTKASVIPCLWFQEIKLQAAEGNLCTVDLAAPEWKILYTYERTSHIKSVTGIMAKM